jgi:hypothetical protein
MSSLSVALPFCRAELDFDLRIVPDAQAGFKVVGARAYLGRAARVASAGAALARVGSPMAITASYALAVAAAEALLEQLYPGVRCYVSERAPLPWMVRT